MDASTATSRDGRDDKGSDDQTVRYAMIPERQRSSRRPDGLLLGQAAQGFEDQDAFNAMARFGHPAR